MLALALARPAPALDLPEAVDAGRQFLARHEGERADLAALLAGYTGPIEPVIQELTRQTFEPVEAGYHPEEHFALPELLERHPDDLLYFTVPATYRPNRPTGLIVFMHGGGSKTSRQAPRVFMSIPDQDGPDSYQLGDVFAATGMVAVGPSAPWDEESSHRWCLKEADEYLADVIAECKSRFNIDHDRVFLVGHSMGGFGAYHHIQRQPDRFAAVVANAGSWTLAHWPVIRGTQLCMVHGVRDARPGIRWHYTDIEYARQTHRLLTERGLDHVFLEHPGEHAVVNAREHLGRFFVSAEQLRRDACYPHVTLATPLGFRPYYRSPVAHNRWLTLDEATDGDLGYDELFTSGEDDFDAWKLEHRTTTRQGASIDAINRGNNIVEVTTHNVARFTVWLHPRMVDIGRPLTIIVDGENRTIGRVTPSLATALESFDRRRDWGLIYPIKVELAAGRTTPTIGQ
ncbi:MAG TPA: alpha/beta hydrolase [Pirellulales bacterium]|nr:alpha/beta hydrolase [Pirellulales bacterium]